MACVDRSNITCNANMKKILPLEDKDNLEGVDRISELPEDIMSTLLFQLEMKEAAKTSILSKRWRYIWTNWSDLDFDYLKIIPECEVYQYPKPIEEIKYINWVNQVINLHRGQSIEKFRVRFGIHESQVHHIDRWVKFALAKKVKKLELELPLYDRSGEVAYNLKPSLFESGISHLTCLSLIDVNVSGELLEFLLTECHHLEQLSVEFSWTLVSLKVASFKLKRLSILNCDALKKLEIDAVNLGYLDYAGDPIIEFKSLPLSLSEAAFSGECCSASIPICQQIACFAMQLSRFSLRYMIDLPGQCITCNIPAKSLPCFSNLKCLVLRYWPISIVDLPSIIRLLGACPVLSEFKMQVCWVHAASIPKEAQVLQGLEPLSLISCSREHHNYIYDHSLEDDVIEYKALPCLRVFQFEGFVGGDDDLNLILTLFKTSVQLHSFICHPLTPSVVGTVTKDEAGHEPMSRAAKLRSFIPPKVKYVITDTYNPDDLL